MRGKWENSEGVLREYETEFYFSSDIKDVTPPSHASMKEKTQRKMNKQKEVSSNLKTNYRLTN